MSLLNNLNNIQQQKGAGFYKELTPAFIYQNLSAAFQIRPYQQEAFGRFVHHFNQQKTNRTPVQLLYHMATGSGKTLVMAGLIMYLYKQGYRNFLFFVNSSNIIDKTRDNFLNKTSSKYLFADNLSIGSKSITIKEVANFQSTNEDEISIAFSTIQGLHSSLNSPKENGITYDDFEDKKLVLISDEAHHINAETKKGNTTNEESISWEATAAKIVNAHNQNILLEFTATMDLSVKEIGKKYADKLLFDYPLKQFRKDGYSKEVQVLQTDAVPFTRALQAMMLSQYRRKIFEQNGLQIKPVILFKSKTIKESEAFLQEFTSSIQNLSIDDFAQLTKRSNPLTARIFDYFRTNKITLENLIAELKDDFSEDKLISVNSKDESEAKQLAINSLEDENNRYRAVFAVDKLNEGWDVLNLFDIVRLYDTKAESKAALTKTTMSEAQLIGRGARYCPFKTNAAQPLFKRKFDDDVAHELRICEELYYHCSYNPEYIVSLSSALETIGIKAPKDETLIVKKATNSPSKSIGKSTENQSNGLPSSIIKNIYSVSISTGESNISSAFVQQETAVIVKPKTQGCLLKNVEEIIVRKAMNQLPFYQFNNLKKLWPALSSVSEFINDQNFLANIQCAVTCEEHQIKNLTAEDKLSVTVQVLEQIAVSPEFNSLSNFQIQ